MSENTATRSAWTSQRWRGLAQMTIGAAILVGLVIGDVAYATPPAWSRALPSVMILFLGLNWLLWPHDNQAPPAIVTRLLGLSMTMAGCFLFFRIISSS